MGMMFEAFTGVLSIRTAGWIKGLNDADGRLLSFRNRTATLFSQVQAASQAVVRGAQNVATVMTAMAAAGASASKVLVHLASNAEEAGSKFQFVFKGATDATRKTLDEFARSAGRSRYELREMAANVGALLEPMGLGESLVSEMSVGFAKLAVDISSFFNVTETDALEAFQSALAGSSEPLRRFGIMLSEDTIQQEALRLGLATTREEVKGAIRTQALYALVMKQTATAQGDAERTAGSYANMMRRLRSQVLDAATTLGNALLPATVQLVGRMSEGLKPISEWISGTENQAYMQALVGAAMDKTTAIVSRLGEAFAYVWGLGVRFAGAFDQVRGFAAQAYEWLQRLWESLPPGARNILMVVAALSTMSFGLSSLGGSIPIIGGVFSALGGLLNPIGLVTQAVGVLRFTMNAAMLPFTLLAAFSARLSVLIRVLTGMFGALAFGLLTGIPTLIRYGAAMLSLVSIKQMLSLAIFGVGRAVAATFALLTSTNVVLLALSAAVAVVVAAFIRFNSIAGSSTGAGNRLWVMVDRIKQIFWGVVNYVGRQWEAFWKRNGDMFDRIAYKIAGVSGGFGEWLTTILPQVANWIGVKLVKSFEVLLWIIEKVAKGVETITDMFNGDFRRATALMNDLLASLVEGFTELLDFLSHSLGEIPFVGDAFRAAADGSRDYARELRNSAQAIRDELKAEDEATRRILANEKRKRDAHLAAQKAAGDARKAEQADADKKAEWDREDAERRRQAAEDKAKAQYLAEQYQARGEAVPEEIATAAAGTPSPVMPTMPAPTMPVTVELPAGTTAPASTPSKAPTTVQLGGVAGQPPIAPITAAEARAQFGGVKKEETGALFSTFKSQLSAALTPDEKGLIDPARAQAVMDKWRTIFGAIPGYSQVAFNKVRDDVNKALEGFVGSGIEMADFYKDRVAKAMGEGTQVFEGGAAENAATMKALLEGTANTAQEVAGGTRALFDKMIADLRGKASAADLRQMVEMRENVVKQVQLIGQAQGKQKEDAVKALGEMLDAYRKTYAEIEKRVETAMDKTAGAHERAAAKGVKSANQQAADERSQRRDRLAAASSGSGGGVSGITQVGNMAQELSAMFTGALGGIGQASANFAEYVSGITDPVEKLDLLIQNANARLGAATINSGIAAKGAGVEQIKAEIRQLQSRKAEAARDAAIERQAAETRRTENYQRTLAEKEARERDARRESNLDLAGAISNGKVAPIVMNVNGVNDVRTAFDTLEKEMLRRGYHSGGKRTLGGKA